MITTVVIPIAVILALVVVNGVFVAAEFALVGARRSRLQTLAEGGSRTARWLVEVFDRPTGKDGYIAIAQLGITLDIQALNWADMVAEAGSPETQADFMAVWQSSAYADLDNFAFPAFHSSQNGNWSNPVYSDPKVEELITAGRQEVDPAKREAIYEEMQEIIVGQASDIYAATLKRLIAHRDNLTGFSYTPIGTNAPEFYSLSLS